MRAGLAMRQSFLCLTVLAAFIWNLHAEAPAEQLLPADTLAVLSMPDWDKTKAVWTHTPQAQLWHDPDMKAFVEKFTSNLQTNLVLPLERELGIKLGDYAGLAHGQITFAVTQNGWDGGSNQSPGWLFLLDVKGQGERLKTNLANLKAKWTASGKPLKTDKIREIEFATLSVAEDDIFKTIRQVLLRTPRSDTTNASPMTTNQFEIWIGQSGSLLLAGNRAKDLEKVLIRQTGGPGPCLAEQPDFRAQPALFNDALVFGWSNLKLVVEGLAQSMPSGNPNPARNPLLPTTSKIMAALGLDGLKSLGFSFVFTPEGYLMQAALRVPEPDRRGLFKMVAFENKEAQPPGFVPANAAKFSRWRLNGARTWTDFETILMKMSPELSGLLQMTLSAAGKSKDPAFDFRKSFLENLGDDFIFYRKLPPNPTLAALNRPSSLFLVGSPKDEALAQTLKRALESIVPANSLKERNVQGRKIVSFPLPPSSGPEGIIQKTLSFAASGGYVAFSTDPGQVEEYLGSTNNKSLKETAGWNEAAQKVGGFSTGLFGFANQNESWRAVLAAVQKDPAALVKSIPFLNPGLAVNVSQGKPPLNDWLDVSLLPPYEKIAKYFHFLVYAAATTPEGFTLKAFAPMPPALKK